MTIDEFDTISFSAEMKVSYKGQIRKIGSVDFEEKLIGLIDEENTIDGYYWVRCENCTLI